MITVGLEFKQRSMGNLGQMVDWIQIYRVHYKVQYTGQYG